jgi:hypothetical protein
MIALFSSCLLGIMHLSDRCNFRRIPTVLLDSHHRNAHIILDVIPSGSPHSDCLRHRYCVIRLLETPDQ